MRTGMGLLVLMVLLASCSRAGVQPTAAPGLTPAPTGAVGPTPAGRLAVGVIYPASDSQLEMGLSTRVSAQVTEGQGNAVTGAQVTVTIRDPAGDVAASLPMQHREQGIYQTAPWSVPHRSLEGYWLIQVEATTALSAVEAASRFSVVESSYEKVLARYGFWWQAPDLRGIRMSPIDERGDARNGKMCWSGTNAAVHLGASLRLEVQWREGDFGLGNAEAPRRFLLEQVGDLGYIRQIGPFQPIQFKQWDAWRAPCRAQYKEDETEVVVFYAPEVSKTYALLTTVVLPPTGVDAHRALRDGFALIPGTEGTGAAGSPLPRLLPGPELISPTVAQRFVGADRPIVLRWNLPRELAEEEYYEVILDYYVRETRARVGLTTRDTQVTVPETIYYSPNCHVFNWQVTLKRRTGTYANGQLQGEPVTYPSLYGYFWWLYPPGEPAAPVVYCPYTHRD